MTSMGLVYNMLKKFGLGEKKVAEDDIPRSHRIQIQDYNIPFDPAFGLGFFHGILLCSFVGVLRLCSFTTAISIGMASIINESSIFTFVTKAGRYS